MNYYMTFKNSENSHPKKETMTDSNNYSKKEHNTFFTECLFIFC